LQVQKHILPKERVPVNGFAHWSLAKYNLNIKNKVITLNPQLAHNRLGLNSSSIEELLLKAKVDRYYGWMADELYEKILFRGMKPYLTVLDAYMTKSYSSDPLTNAIKQYIALRGLLFDGVINPTVMSVGFTDITGKIENKKTIESYTANGRVAQHSLNSALRALYSTRFCVPQVGGWHLKKDTLVEELQLNKNSIVKKITSKHGLIVCNNYKLCPWCWIRKIHAVFDEEVKKPVDPSVKYKVIYFTYRFQYGYLKNIREPLKELTRKAVDKLTEKGEEVYRVINSIPANTALDPSGTFVDVTVAYIAKNNQKATVRRIQRYIKNLEANPMYKVQVVNLYEADSMLDALKYLATGEDPVLCFNNFIFTGLVQLKQFKEYLVKNYKLFEELANRNKTHWLEWYIHDYVEFNGMHTVQIPT